MITDDFVAYAGRVQARFDQPRDGDELTGLVSRTISSVAKGCMRDGARLIGHIKCIAEGDSGKYIACSVVSADSEAICRREMDERSMSLNLVMNVLIYGLDKARVEGIVVRSAREIFPARGMRLEFEDLEHEEHGHCESESVHEGHEHEGHEHEDQGHEH